MSPKGIDQEDWLLSLCLPRNARNDVMDLIGHLENTDIESSG